MRISGLAAMKWLGAALMAWWLRDLPLAMQTLIAFMAIDYATGIAAALMEGRLSSRIGLRGLVQKGSIICFLMLGHRVEMLIGHEWGAEAFGAFGYSINEVISIVENFARLGVPLPDKAITVLGAMRNLCVVRRATPEQLRRLRGE